MSGLAAAHRLLELGLEPVVLERSARCGGVVLTEEVEGFLVEGGPDSFLARKPWAAALCRRVGLESEIVPTDPANRGSFVWFRGRLHPLPEGLTALVPTRLAPLLTTALLSTAGKARLLAEPLVPRATSSADESLGGFFRRRLGREASLRLVEPLVRGIYGGDPEALSLRATFPQLAEIEQRHGSLLRGILRETDAPGRARRNGELDDREGSAGFLALRGGMGSLVERLVAALAPGEIRLGCGVRDLRRRAVGGWEIGLADGDVLRPETVIIALPPPSAAPILDPLDARLGSLVAGIRCASSVTVSLGLERAQVRHRLRGYGFVVPDVEGGPLIACTWSSSKFPGRAPAGAVLVRAFLARPETLLDQPDDALARLACDALRPILGVAGEPRVARVHRWREALPRYTVGHPQRVAEIERRLAGQPGLFLCGAGYRGLGLPDCVRAGELAAQAAADHVAGTSALGRRYMDSAAGNPDDVRAIPGAA